VTKAVQARGGPQKLHAVQSLRLGGRVSLGPKAGGLLVEFKRPNRMRMEVHLPEGTLLRLFDGSKGWTSQVASATPLLAPMSPAELARTRREADLDGPLLDSAAKGIRFALAGQGEVSGRATDLLDVYFPDGTVQRYQLDATTHEPLGWDETQHQDGKVRVEETRFRVNRRVEGILFPILIESGVHAGTLSSRINIDSIELNPSLDDARFRPTVGSEAPSPNGP